MAAGGGRGVAADGRLHGIGAVGPAIRGARACVRHCVRHLDLGNTAVGADPERTPVGGAMAGHRTELCGHRRDRRAGLQPVAGAYGDRAGDAAGRLVRVGVQHHPAARQSPCATGGGHDSVADRHRHRAVGRAGLGARRRASLSGGAGRLAHHPLHGSAGHRADLHRRAGHDAEDAARGHVHRNAVRTGDRPGRVVGGVP
ncbi:hypothetical protein G6F65_020262 [Rhizopus arrhizus]|nr:hypothetical protein G6F65_020262 [Rhizopus arrhizus]